LRGEERGRKSLLIGKGKVLTEGREMRFSSSIVYILIRRGGERFQERCWNLTAVCWKED